MIWAETDHLSLDDEGILYRRYHADDAPLRRRLWELRGRRVEQLRRRVGSIDGWVRLPAWLVTEAAELADLWSDAARYDERGEWRATYERNLGLTR